MAIHLTNDNGVAAFGESKNHLGGVSTSQYGDHLVVVRQATNWTDKEFVVTPDATQDKYCYAFSMGKERYYNQQGGPAVYNDTNTLVTNVRNSFGGSWKDGNCALFSVTSRRSGPYANFYKFAHSSSIWPSEYSEYGSSIVAYRLNLRHLHFNLMGSYKAYARCWGASMAVYRMEMGHSWEGLLINGAFYGGTSQLKVRLYDSLPTLAWDVAEGADSLEFGNHVNNGRVVTKDTYLNGPFAIYNPFNDRQAYDTDGNSSRIYTAQDYHQAPPIPSPTNYYHDFELTSAVNMDVLGKNPGYVWLVAGFHQGNGFSDGNQGQNGLIQGGATTAFCERIELVLKCTSTKFNDN